jgi:hypothetical protein
LLRRPDACGSCIYSPRRHQGQSFAIGNQPSCTTASHFSYSPSSICLSPTMQAMNAVIATTLLAMALLQSATAASYCPSLPAGSRCGGYSCSTCAYGLSCKYGICVKTVTLPPPTSTTTRTTTTTTTCPLLGEGKFCTYDKCKQCGPGLSCNYGKCVKTVTLPPPTSTTTRTTTTTTATCPLLGEGKFCNTYEKCKQCETGLSCSSTYRGSICMRRKHK